MPIVPLNGCFSMHRLQACEWPARVNQIPMMVRVVWSVVRTTAALEHDVAARALFGRETAHGPESPE